MMSATPSPESVRCAACGRPLSVLLDTGELPIICPQCGSRTDRPVELVADDDDRHLLVAGSRDDDGQAYGVFGEKPVPPCPSCGRRLPENAGVCEHCNWHRDAGKVLPRTFAPFHQTWEAGWSFSQRLTAFLACQLLNFITAGILLATKRGLPTTISGWVLFTGLQAFVLGTYDRLTLTRTTKGKVTLAKTWRVCFWPLPPKPIRWREYEGIIVRLSAAGALEWLMLLMLVPGIVLPFLWWWYVIRPDHVTVALTENLGDPAWILYTGTDKDRAKEIAGTVQSLTTLPCDPPV